MPVASTSLAELARLVRHQDCQERRRSVSRVRLHRCLVSTALSARLVRCGDLAHKTIVDCFRSDDKKSFSSILDALHDVRDSCDATRRFALLDPDTTVGQSGSLYREESERPVMFMNQLSPRSRGDIIAFLTKIRTEPEFLAERLSGLSSSELLALTTHHLNLDPVDSVMPLHPRGKAHGLNMHRTPGSIPAAVERLLSFQRHDPLSALLYTVFANTSGADSPEDRRRTEVWSTTCARLINESTPGSEQFMRVVLNAWASMRDWPARSALELFLMKVLQDGAFLLEKADDQQKSLRVQMEAGPPKEAIAADMFYENAVKGLFTVIDDVPSAGGVPAGALELGHAIIRKLDDPKKQRTARTFLVSKWFFSTFLLNAVIHPESHGIMTEFHINEYARQKILKEIAVRAQKYVWDVTFNWKQAAPILPEIRSRIENIHGCFSDPHSYSPPLLSPATNLTSPQEVMEVQPFLVLCPADIRTLVSALFPERRPSSRGIQTDVYPRSTRSVTSSVSGLAMPCSPDSPSLGGDSSSRLSRSASSITSDATSREPLLDTPGQTADERSSFTSFNSHETLHTFSEAHSVEDYGQTMRIMISDMTRTLGLGVMSGSCHPCAEQWTVLYVAADGKSLSRRLRNDWEDEDDEDDSPESDSEGEVATERLGLGQDYHQLKEATFQLVKDYEIPRESSLENSRREYGNSAASTGNTEGQLDKPPRISPSKTLDSTFKNPCYDQSHSSERMTGTANDLSDLCGSLQQRSASEKERCSSGGENSSVLVTMLERAISQCRATGNFVTAHFYWASLQHLRRLTPTSLAWSGFATLINNFSRGPRDSLRRLASAIEETEAWLIWTRQSLERHSIAVRQMMTRASTLRNKMWYMTDVKNSAPYEEAKNVSTALKAMLQSSKPSQGKPVQGFRARNLSKASTNFLLRTGTQVLDMMVATKEQGGLTKLSDQQSEMTSKWLVQYGIENFCKGEERIHRFSLEIDRCINKIVGNDLLDGPVLWSSELFYRDKRSLDNNSFRGEDLPGGVSSSASDTGFTDGLQRNGLRSWDLGQRQSTRDLRAMAALNGSQHSFDSGRWSTTRSVPSLDIMDSQEGSIVGSSTLSIDQSATYWSPFQSQASYPTRPRTALSANEATVFRRPDSVHVGKRRFLLDLRQHLTGLLLSDLGGFVFGQGSETDSWFSSDLGEECLQRKEEKDVRRRRRLAQRCSLKNMRKEQFESKNNLHVSLERDLKSEPAMPITTLEHVAHDAHPSEEIPSSGDATARSPRLGVANTVESPEFPFRRSFSQLLNKFSIHTNPITKLHVLQELEILILASLGDRRGQGQFRDNIVRTPLTPFFGSLPESMSHSPNVHIPRAKNLDEAIANCEERRSNTMVRNQRATPFRTQSGSGPTSGPPSTDMIVEVLQGLFRDASIRPKSLFRDLQFIAAFVPSQILDETECGKAFWNASLAALGLKQDVCKMMVEIADDIVAYQTKNRSLLPGRRMAEDARSSELARYGMEDAARMWSITAKEGDPVAQRELAIFYLTHPDLLPRMTLPLSMPKDTFKAQVMNQRNEDPTRSDPATMCVAYHWMELSAQGGDDLAHKYLRSREEINALP
ncbi:MAG: hypothetical protein M1833_001846 [Piccolia ochrophora]|nr:MAG: hypothetical protein M1833_001846 [Piccolia ochrophora]